VIDADAGIYFKEHRAKFGRLTQGQVNGIGAILLGMADDARLNDIRQAAYMMATAWHETAATMLPIAERGPVSYFNRYDPVLAPTERLRARARSMGNLVKGDGFRFRGRGYVQLTWARNYRRGSDVVRVDLIADPDRAMDPDIAYEIMSAGMRDGWFTGVGLDRYIRANHTDYINARRIINGTDKAALIAGYARTFESILRAAT
jgi:hypothetical protein